MPRKREYYTEYQETPDGYIMTTGETDRSVMLRAFRRKSRAKPKPRVFEGELGTFQGVRFIEDRKG